MHLLSAVQYNFTSRFHSLINTMLSLTHTHNRFTVLLDFVRDYRVSRYQKGKTNLDLLEQETVSGSGICWAICKSYPK